MANGWMFCEVVATQLLAVHPIVSDLCTCLRLNQELWRAAKQIRLEDPHLVRSALAGYCEFNKVDHRARYQNKMVHKAVLSTPYFA